MRVFHDTIILKMEVGSSCCLNEMHTKKTNSFTRELVFLVCIIGLRRLVCTMIEHIIKRKKIQNLNRIYYMIWKCAYFLIDFRNCKQMSYNKWMKHPSGPLWGYTLSVVGTKSVNRLRTFFVLNVNFYILVYIQFIDFTWFITLYSFPSKTLTKVYIQNVTNKEVRASWTKKEKARSMLAFFT